MVWMKLCHVTLNYVNYVICNICSRKSNQLQSRHITESVVPACMAAVAKVCPVVLVRDVTIEKVQQTFDLGSFFPKSLLVIFHHVVQGIQQHLFQPVAKVCSGSGQIGRRRVFFESKPLLQKGMHGVQASLLAGSVQLDSCNGIKWCSHFLLL